MATSGLIRAPLPYHHSGPEMFRVSRRGEVETEKPYSSKAPLVRSRTSV